MSDPGSAGAQVSFAGRRLVDVLRDLELRGLDLVYSTAVVTPDLVVRTEPGASDPRGILDEILTPLGLRAQEGPAGSILILPAVDAAGRIGGRVLSATRGRPIGGATILLSTSVDEAPESETVSARTTISAPDGSFRFLKVPPGAHRLTVRAPGFTPERISPVSVRPGSETELVIALASHPMFVTEVVVTPGRHDVIRQEQVPRHTITRDDAILVPTIGGDVSRVVELLPGVAAPDNSAAFNVRGSIAEDVSFVLDGLELYDPYHLQSFHSPFSLIDANVVDRIEFFGGGFTADLGDRHGGFVEISSISAADATRGEAEVGNLNSRFSYRSPFSRLPGSWLLSARAWYPEALMDTIEVSSGERLDPRFADVYAKATFSPLSRHLFSAHGLLSYDRLTFQETDEDVNESVNALTRNGYLWLRALSVWSDVLSSETMVSGGRIERLRTGVSSATDLAKEVDDHRTVDFWGLKHDVSWHVSERHVFKTGIDVRRLSSAYDYDVRAPDDPSADRTFRTDPDGTSLGVYLAHRTRVSSTLATEIGVRWDRQTTTRDNQVSPRFNAVWQPARGSEVRLAVGRYQQSQRIHELNVEDGDTAFYPAEVSEQAEMSFQQTFPAGLRFRLDAYYRELSRLRPRYENLFEPVELFPETAVDRVLVAPSEARLRGVELFLRGDADQRLFWSISYALASAEDEVHGRLVPRSWDQTHAGKFLVGLRRDGRWSVTLSGTARSGWPTTPATGAFDPVSSEIERVPGPRNSDRLPSYMRFDAKARRSFSMPRGRLWLTFEVVNLTDRDNACCLDEFRFTRRPGGRIDAERLNDNWLGITPSFSALWEF